MKKISIITTMTNPDDRNDPWKEALECYRDLADEVIIVGQDWPYEFEWSHIGKTFQKGYEKATGDWVIRMDLDYFFHENDILNIRKTIEKFNNFPIVSFPQHQFFTEKKYSLRTLIGIAVNKSKFPDIRLNGGGDLCLPTLNGDLLNPFNYPISKYPIYQYDSFFRTREIIAVDRARFARAWERHFGDYGDRGGPTEEAAIVSWENMIKNKIIDHIYKFNPDKHPKYIKQKVKRVEKDAFGYNAFGINYKLPGIKVVIKEIKKLLKIYIVRKKFEFTSI